MSLNLRSARGIAPVVLVIAILLQGLGVASAQSLREDSSLSFVPAGTSFYVTMLRNSEQYERLAKSKAFEKLRSMPLVQMATAQMKQQMEEQGISDFLDEVDNQELLAMLCDAVSEEVFVFSDDRFAVWVSAMNRISNTLNMVQLKAMQTGEDPEVVTQREMINLFLNDPALLRSPTTVVGFHLSNVDQAQKQIVRLENLLREQLDANAPQLRDRLTREKIGGGDFLTFRVDGTLVPWDDVLEDVDLDEQDIQKLAGQLSQAKLAISIGVWQSYLLLSIGEDNSLLANLGQGELLVDTPELQPLKKADGKLVTSVGYASGDFMRRVSAIDQQINQMVEVVEAVAPFIPGSDEVRDDLIADAKKFGEEVKAKVPKMGAVMGYTYMVDNGYESLSYNWTEQKGLDGSKPLSILNHVGSSPIAFFATRGKAQPEAAEFASRWCAKAFEYAERIGTPFMDEEQVELMTAVKKEMTPLFERIAKANREKLGPAFADGQSAVVLDAEITSDSWSVAMPPSDVELPLPELCLVYGVSDAQLVKEGFTEYFNVLQEGIMTMSELMPDQVPPLPIPPPQVEVTDHGTVFSYPMPPVAGLDERISPNAGLSDNALVLSLVPSATQRLLAADRLPADSLITTDRPLAYAWQFSTAEFIKMVRPWVEYGFDVAAEEGAVDEEIESQVNTVLDVLSCFRKSNGVAFFEDGVLVSHARSVVKDLDQ